MSLFIILIAAGMLAYWLVRGWLVALGPEELIVQALQEDEWAFHRLRLLLRTLFFPGMEIGPF
jgi:hypothetical protein